MIVDLIHYEPIGHGPTDWVCLSMFASGTVFAGHHFESESSRFKYHYVSTGVGIDRTVLNGLSRMYS